MNTLDRRTFLQTAGTLLTASVLPSWAEAAAKRPFFQISLAEWSLHKALFANKMTNLDFPVLAKKEFGISIVEYVSTFMKDKAQDKTYLNELLLRCRDNGVSNHLIMIDGEGPLADLDAAKRNLAVENHKKWIECARYLGCKTIRVNAQGSGEPTEVAKAAVDGLSKLGEIGKASGINVIVENHGGLSSNGAWLAGVMKQVGMKNVGTLPDFGNFCLKRNAADWHICEESYDRYKGTEELLPFAKGVSAKTYDFDAQGNCIETDYSRMISLMKASKFRGIVGIEYEGEKADEYTGIRKTKALLERLQRPA